MGNANRTTMQYGEEVTAQWAQDVEKEGILALPNTAYTTELKHPDTCLLETKAWRDYKMHVDIYAVKTVIKEITQNSKREQLQ